MIKSKEIKREMEKIRINKIRKNVLMIFALIGILILFSELVCSQETVKPYDPNDPSTWTSSKDNFKTFTENLGNDAQLNKINSIMENSNPEQKEFIFNNIKRITGKTVILEGFGNKELKFAKSQNGQILVTNKDGSAVVDLTDFHKELKGVEYVPGDEKTPAKFTYKFSSGRQIDLEKGTFRSSDGIYMEYKDGKLIETKTSFLLPEKNSKVTAGKDGIFSLENGAKLKSDGLEFSQNIKTAKSYLKKVDGQHFEAMNVIADRGDLAVTIPDGKKTDIILKARPSTPDSPYVIDAINPNQYIRIDDKGKIDMVGEGIGLELKQDGKVPYKIRAEGTGLTVKNENVNYKINREKVGITRNVDDYKNLHPFELTIPGGDKTIYSNKYVTGTAEAKPGETKPAETKQNPVPEKVTDAVKPAETKTAETKPTTETKPGAGASKVDVKTTKNSNLPAFVCAGTCIDTSKIAGGDTAEQKIELKTSDVAKLPPNLDEAAFLKIASSESVEKNFDIKVLLEQVPAAAAAKLFTEEYYAAGGPITSGLMAKSIKAEIDYAYKQGYVEKGEVATFKQMVDGIVQDAGFNFYYKNSNFVLNLKSGQNPTATIQGWDETKEDWVTRTVTIADPAQKQVLIKFLQVSSSSPDKTDGQIPPQVWRDAYQRYKEIKGMK